MIHWLFLLLFTIVMDARHFNGGTLHWIPVNPYDNSSSVTITIIQSYWWTYPVIQCSTDVPISTPGRSTQGVNLTCVGNCSVDGGYSTNPIDILTDCTSFSSALNMTTSQRSKNVTLSSNAHLSLAYTGGTWVGLNQPPQPGLNWSIVMSIDLRMRPDGLINTPPTAIVFSPQYAIVNKTTRIEILVSDVNINDEIRCRWSLKSSASFIDECDGACYPASIPSGANLSDCTLIIQGPTDGIWYGASIQVEDFIDSTSVTPMSSVPVQFLIYVIPEPICSKAPVFIPLTGCLEVKIAVPKSIDIYVFDPCNPNVVSIADIVVTDSSNGMQLSTLSSSPTNASLFYKTLTWTPQPGQLGPQRLCMTAYTDEFVQSAEYCVTFVVIASSQPCVTTTTSTSTSTTATTATVGTGMETPASTTEKGPSWGLIAGIASVALPLALCSFLCLYRLLWNPAAKREQQGEEVKADEDRWNYRHLSSNSESTLRTTTPSINENSPIEVPRKPYQVYNIVSKPNPTNQISSTVDSEGSILVSIYNNTNGKRSTNIRTNNTEEAVEMEDAWIQPRTSEIITNDKPITRRITMIDNPANQWSNVNARDRSSTTGQPFNTDHSSALECRAETMSGC